jgi:hypothetical protein
MALNDAANNAMLDHLAGLIVYVSLHSADPGATGADEIAGGSPAYARQPVTWNPATASNLDNDTEPVFDVPGGGVTVTHGGLWDSQTAGTFYGGVTLDTPETFAAQGTYTFTDIDVTLS